MPTKPTNAEAYAEGHAAGRAGLPSDQNPYAAASAATYWRNGWNAGHGEWLCRTADNHRLIEPAREPRRG